MPELPEVETTRRGLHPHVTGRRIVALTVHEPRLRWRVPDDLPAKVGLDFDMTQITFAIYGFLLVIMMILRPQGLLPERRRAEEMTHGDEVSEDSLYTARA